MEDIPNDKQVIQLPSNIIERYDLERCDLKDEMPEDGKWCPILFIDEYKNKVILKTLDQFTLLLTAYYEYKEQEIFSKKVSDIILPPLKQEYPNIAEKCYPNFLKKESVEYIPTEVYEVENEFGIFLVKFMRQMCDIEAKMFKGGLEEILVVPPKNGFPGKIHDLEYMEKELGLLPKNLEIVRFDPSF